MSFENGSIGTVHYFSNGTQRYPKEQLTVYADGRVLVMKNFRRLDEFGRRKRNLLKTRRQDKGHHLEIESFIQAVKGGNGPPIPYNELFEVSEAAIRVSHPS